MCGRFVSARKRLELLEEFGVERDKVAASPDHEPDADYNVAPTMPVYAVVTRLPKDGEDGLSKRLATVSTDAPSRLGVVGRDPRWAIAWKFPPTTATTATQFVRFDTGRALKRSIAELAEAYGYVNRSLPDAELDEFVDAFVFTRFEPAGPVTGNDSVKSPKAGV